MNIQDVCEEINRMLLFPLVAFIDGPPCSLGSSLPTVNLKDMLKKAHDRLWTLQS